MTWLLGHKLITVTTSGCSQKALKNGLCDKCWLLCKGDKGGELFVTNYNTCIPTTHLPLHGTVSVNLPPFIFCCHCWLAVPSLGRTTVSARSAVCVQLLCVVMSTLHSGSFTFRLPRLRFFYFLLKPLDMFSVFAHKCLLHLYSPFRK